MKLKNIYETYGINSRIKLFFIISILIAILDQSCKFFAFRFGFYKVVLIPNFLWLTLVENTGAAFGFFQGKSYLLGLFNILVFLLILYFNFKYKLTLKDYVPLAFIAGGAIGNSIDRLIFGSVVDFIDLGWFPTFNLADSFIVIGFILLIVSELFSRKKES